MSPVVELEPRASHRAHIYLAILALGFAVGMLTLALSAEAEHQRLSRRYTRERGRTIGDLDAELDQARAEADELRERLQAHEHSEDVEPAPGQ